MPNRPDHIHCIAHTHAEKAGTAWCGRTLEPFEWRFLDIDHAAYNGLAQGRTQTCAACVNAVVAALGREPAET
jgi:hypothetical protein